MFSKIRSLIFKLDPELAHTLAIKALKFNYNPINNVPKDNSIETSIFGKKIFNPVGIAAGFDKDAEVYNPLFRLGFGFVEVGTITPLKQYGNPKPRVFRLEEDEALINRLGFNNSGADIISSRIKSNSPNGLFGINIGPNKDTKNRLEDYLICLRKFHTLSDYLTINISSPNTENLRSFHNQNELDELLNAIQEEKQTLKSETPIAVKISPDIDETNIERIAELFLKYNICLNIGAYLIKACPNDAQCVYTDTLDLGGNHFVSNVFGELEFKINIARVSHVVTTREHMVTLSAMCGEAHPPGSGE